MKNVRIRKYNRRKGTVKKTSSEYAGMVIQTADLYVYYNGGGERDVRFTVPVCIPSDSKSSFNKLIVEVKNTITSIVKNCITHEQIILSSKDKFEFNKHGYIVGVK